MFHSVTPGQTQFQSYKAISLQVGLTRDERKLCCNGALFQHDLKVSQKENDATERIDFSWKEWGSRLMGPLRTVSCQNITRLNLWKKKLRTPRHLRTGFTIGQTNHPQPAKFDVT